MKTLERTLFHFQNDRSDLPVRTFGKRPRFVCLDVKKEEYAYEVESSEKESTTMTSCLLDTMRRSNQLSYGIFYETAAK